MKGAMIAGAFTLLAVSAAGAQTPQTSSGTPEIVVSARGEVRIVPDRASIMFAIETRSPSAASASATNSRVTASVMDALKRAGLAASDVNTLSFNVHQDYERPTTTRSAPTPTGFIARNMMRADVRQVGDAGHIIDAALAAGATQVAAVQFTAGNLEEARRRALTVAVGEARRDAETLAQAAGGSLGRLLALTSTQSSPMMRGREEVVFSSGSGVGIVDVPSFNPRELSVFATASARWEFIPRQ